MLADITASAMPLQLHVVPSFFKNIEFWKWNNVDFSHSDCNSFHLSIFLENSSIISSKLPYFRISEVGLAALSSIIFSSTFLYSSFVKGPVCIVRLLSLIVFRLYADRLQINIIYYILIKINITCNRQI